MEEKGCAHQHERGGKNIISGVAAIGDKEKRAVYTESAQGL